MCARARVCVCVCERERESGGPTFLLHFHVCILHFVCAYVRVCVRPCQGVKKDRMSGVSSPRQRVKSDGMSGVSRLCQGAEIISSLTCSTDDRNLRS